MPTTLEQRTALALSALGEITDPSDVGELLGVEEVGPGVVDVRFACTLGAYAGWHWTVSTSDLPDVDPTVLEVELLPGDGALLAPPWVPWTERLAEWRAQHPDERHPDEPASDDEDDDGDDQERDEDEVDDEDDLAVDDELDELDESELDGVEAPEESEQDTGDIDDEQDTGDIDDEDDTDGDTEEERLREV